ncbi:tumor protein d52 family domain-containing protein [Ditylenchus destructor]|uniref:Tumor protein d52 family domain-containing protein n=1 Tax=Ditylenchus destructor TaxID=166010 RepID=A0AAD4MPW2_9BILA|nr:tumor protein d52 family domain-containing protein [Ditylenchus destructor]
MATPGIEVADSGAENGADISDAEKELIREELKKTENEIATLRQLLAARQKHVATLKRKLGISPLTEITEEVSHGLRTVKETPAYQKTSEVVTGTAESVANKWADMRNSSLFKSFESKLGSAYSNAKMAASTSIDHLAGATRPSQNNSQAGTPRSEQPPAPLS